MRRLLVFHFVLALVAIITACGPKPSAENSATNDTPTDSYKRLYAAVKAKDTEAIKHEMSRKTHDLAKTSAQRQKIPIEKVYENGFTATMFAASLPEIRDERVDGNMGAIEVWNSKSSIWEDLPFVVEDGQWKLAVGDVFAGTFKSPGKGRAQREAEAANSMRPAATPTSNVNVNTVQVQPQR